MRFILDTHVFIWGEEKSHRLRPEVLEMMRDPANDVIFSAVVSWEIAVKYSIGKLDLPEPPRLFVERRIVRESLTPLPINHDHTLRVADLPMHHRDPFDRLLIAQSQIERLPLVTADPNISRYDVDVIPAA